MRRKHEILRLRTDARGDQRSNRRNHAVYNNRHTILHAAQKRARHTGDFQTAHLSQHIHRIIRIRLIDRQRPLNRMSLTDKPSIRQPRAASGQLLRRKTQQSTGHGGGSGRIADAHFAGQDDLIALHLHFAHQIHSGLQRALCLFVSQRRLFCHICSTRCNSSVNRPGNRMKHAHIHRIHVRMDRRSHQIDIGCSFGNRLRNQSSHFAAGLRNTLRHHAVIGAENQSAPPVNAHVRRFLNAGDFDDHIFQQSQRMKRFRNVIPLPLRLLFCVHTSS